jgi:glycosyltransferase involved in cell wall biosynthesis
MYSSTMSKFKKNILSIMVALKTILLRSKYDVIVIDGGPLGNWISWLQTLLVFGKKPTIFLDCLWSVQKNPLKHKVKCFLHRFSSYSVSRLLVWARHEVDDFSTVFGIPKEKFIFHPFHSTLEGYVFDTKDEGFIFAGGNSDRDYRTLIDAVRGTDIPVFIAATDNALFDGIKVPDNVTIKNLSHEEFRSKMASCRISVVPIRQGTLRSPGQQTFLNSMAMSKPTIVVGPRDADGYITHDYNGMIVDYCDTAGLGAAIKLLYYDSAYRDRLGRNAFESVSKLTTDAFFTSIYGIAQEIVGLSKK